MFFSRELVNYGYQNDLCEMQDLPMPLAPLYLVKRDQIFQAVKANLNLTS